MGRFRNLVRDSQLGRLARVIIQTRAQLERLQIAVGRLQERVDRGEPDFHAHEFGVFSQWGEDGLLAYLTSRVPIEQRSFVEFGVENYRESNTRYLLVAKNWRGLVIDASEADIREIKADDISWRHDLEARCAFITTDNINELIGGAGFTGDIGVLSIDVDGNDYWIWKAIEVVSPRIVVVEYNSTYGGRRAVTIPYTPDFDRMRAHHSGLYFGASIAAFARLGKAKGYALVGSNSAGNNAFFVRRDVLGSIPELGPHDAYRQAQFRESRDAEGNLTYLRFADRARAIGELTVHDLDAGRDVTVGELA